KSNGEAWATARVPETRRRTRRNRNAARARTAVWAGSTRRLSGARPPLGGPVGLEVSLLQRPGPVLSQHAHLPVGLDHGQAHLLEIVHVVEAQLRADVVLVHALGPHALALELPVPDDHGGCALQQLVEAVAPVAEPGVGVV